MLLAEEIEDKSILMNAGVSQVANDDLMPLEVIYGQECLDAVSNEFSLRAVVDAIRVYPAHSADILLAAMVNLADSDRLANELSSDLRCLAKMAAAAISGDFDASFDN